MVVAALALAICALIVSVVALRAARTDRVAVVPAAPPAAVDARIEPNLRVSITEGEARRVVANDTRDYALGVTLINGSDTAIDVSRVTLRVTYRTRANFLGAVDLVSRQDATYHSPRPLIEMPLTIQGRATARGWLLFSTANVIPRHCRVADYALILETSQGQRYTADATLLSMLAADTDGAGPATWGWD